MSSQYQKYFHHKGFSLLSVTYKSIIDGQETRNWSERGMFCQRYNIHCRTDVWTPHVTQSESLLLVLNPQHSKNTLQNRLSYWGQILCFLLDWIFSLSIRHTGKACIHKAKEDSTQLCQKHGSRNYFLPPISPLIMFL